MRCLVVGGTRKLGGAVAIDLARRGVRIAVSTRDPTRMAPCLAELRRLQPGLTVVVGDVRSRLDARHIVRSAAEALGGLDAVIYAASGPFVPQAPEDVDEVAWDASTDVIARGFLFCAQAAREVFLEALHRPRLTASSAAPPQHSGPAPQRGAIVAITDRVDDHSWPRLASHYAAKAAQIALVRLLAAAWHGDGVRVFGIAPAPVDLPDDERRDATLRAADCQGYCRLVRPEEVAAAILRCLDDPRLTGVDVEVLPD